MKTMRKQVAMALLLTMLMSWATAFAIRYNEIRRAETGLLDTMMRDSARQALLSVPTSLLHSRISPDDEHFELPDADAPRFEKIFQFWSLQDRRLLLSSPGTLDEPLVGDFSEGFHDIRLDGKTWRVYALSDRDGRIQVQFAKSHQQLNDDAVARMRTGLEFQTILFVILTGVTWWVIRRAFRPVEQARESILSRSDMDLTPLPRAGMPGELQPFISAINHLLRRLAASLERERQFLADAAHELRTPLSAMSTYAEVAATGGSPPVRQQAVEKLRDVAARTARLVEQLLDHARVQRLDERQAQPVELGPLVEMIVRDSEALAARKRQRISLNVQPASVSGEVDALGVLLRNLLDNALRYTAAGGRIAVACGTLPDGKVRLSVKDNGPGIAPAERERVFDRFYRIPGTPENGSGIGLALVAHIAASHGARLDWGPGLDGAGVGVTVTF
ncbi:ATP-binding protein [Cupriavidus respiraculi]|uniref:histidine kinase n=1 Tax=Cupriavidus respiraculi TaxID=195930 RepID=A0ABM8WFF0_9BURK|nr:ATP-binding protein [Cupriavidus respiraculi]CAG9166049.1 Adaptive-response sensory-kinase SasA [Cupriavidus respiraculi]